MREEAALLDVTRYFDGGVYGALDDYQKLLEAHPDAAHPAAPRSRGRQFLGFGDGYVEIENVKQVGGVAVGVATDEPECRVPDQWKRKRLVGVGADFIVPNFLCHDELLEMLFPHEPLRAVRPLAPRDQAPRRAHPRPAADHWLALDDAVPAFAPPRPAPRSPPA